MKSPLFAKLRTVFSYLLPARCEMCWQFLISCHNSTLHLPLEPHKTIFIMHLPRYSVAVFGGRRKIIIIFAAITRISIWQRIRKRRDTITKVGKNLRILKYSNDLYIFTPINRNLMEKSL